MNINQPNDKKLEINKASIKTTEKASKQIVVIASFLQGSYFAAVSLSDIKKVGKLDDTWFILFIIFSALIMICCMISIYFASRVFVPRNYDPEKELDTIYQEASDYKYSRLKYSTWLLFVTFILLLFSILIYLIFLPPSP